MHLARLFWENVRVGELSPGGENTRFSFQGTVPTGMEPYGVPEPGKDRAMRHRWLCFVVSVLTMAEDRPKCPVCGDEMAWTGSAWICLKDHGRV